MDLLIEGLPSDFDLQNFVAAYAKDFSIEITSDGNSIVTIPHEISPLMIIDLLKGQKINGDLITVKKIKEKVT